MDSFAGHSETFTATLVDDKGSDDIRLNLSIDGLKVMDRTGKLTKRKIPLDHITRWTRASDRLTMFVKTPVDIEEKAVSFYAPHSTLTSLLDTLTCFCLQLVEIMEAKEEQEAANEIRAVARNGGRRHKQLKNADEVEFWSNPEKAGWLQSQGEVIKTWRKRWFVLKDGFLFRFLDDKVGPSSKPRGIVDLSKVGEVGCGKGVTNRANSIKVGRQNGHVVYLTDSETDMVEWISALEATVSRLVRIIAGVEDEPPAGRTDGGRGAGARPSSNNAAFLKQMEETFKSGGGGGGGLQRGHQPSHQPPTQQQQQMSDPFAYAGSANYPGIAAPPSMPQVPVYRGNSGGVTQSHPPAMSSGVYRDQLGVTYGMGSGTSINGIAGVAGVRSGGAAAGLPSHLTIADPSYAGGAGSHQSAAPDFQGSSYQPPSFSGHQGYGQPQPQSALPDTITVTSIIDQPPVRSSSYGIGGQNSFNYSQQQQQQQPQLSYQQQQQSAYQQQAQQQQPVQDFGLAQHQAQWQTHYTPEGRPYYYNASSGQSVWEPPQ